MRAFIFQGAVLAAIAAILVTTLCAILCPAILRLLSTPSAIYQDAYDYLFVIFLGIPFSILYNYQASILRAVGDSKTPFFFLAFSTVLNIALDLLCIVVSQLGCGGHDHRAGDQRRMLFFLYYNTLSDAASTEGGSLHGPPEGSDPSDHGTSHGAAIFDHRHRKHGHAVRQQQSGRHLCVWLYRRRTDQAVCHEPF